MNVKSTDWTALPMPAECDTLSVDLRFSREQMQRIQRGHVPEGMDDRWFLYWEDNQLFFCRSWNGMCAYIVRFEATDEGMRAVEIRMNRENPGWNCEETDEQWERQFVGYLIDSYLLDRNTRYPDYPADRNRSARRDAD